LLTGFDRRDKIEARLIRSDSAPRIRLQKPNFPLKFTLLLIIFTLASLCGNAQTATPSPQGTPKPVAEIEDLDVVRVTTNLIQIDAVVTDKSGKFVRNLKPEDLEVFVNGRPQQITNFSVVERDPAPLKPDASGKSVDPSAGPMAAVRLRRDQVKRTIAVLIADYGMDCRNTPYVRKALESFVDRQVQAGDLVAIVRTGSGVGTLQQFTSDKRELYAAIEKVRYSPAVGKCFGVGPTPMYEADKARDALLPKEDPGVKATEDIEEFHENIRFNSTLDAVDYVTRGMAHLPGRKALVLFSDGLNTERSHTRDRIREIADSANRAGVVIYTIDARGLVADGLTAADLQFGLSSQQIASAMHGRSQAFSKSQDGLIFLADQGGGFSIRNTNDLAGGIRKAFDDQNNYYVIGFQPDISIFETAKTRFNKLTVRSRIPGLTIRYRSGFFGVEDRRQERTSPATPQQKILEALTSPFASTDIDLRLTPLFGNDSAGSFVRALVHIPGDKLTFASKPDGSREAVINVVAYTFGNNGIILGTAAETHTLTLTESLYTRALARGLVYSLRVPIKNPGGFQLRVAVRDDKSERIGSASQFIIAPNLKTGRLALSGIALSSSDPGKANPGIDGSRPSTGEVAGESMLTQAAIRRFKANQVLQFAYVIYNAKIAKTSGHPRLIVQTKLYRDGKRIFAGNPTTYNDAYGNDPARLIAEGALQLGGLRDGEYVLEVVVRDMLTDEKRAITRGWIDFEIAK
jgi:VWFA-related protein